MATATYISSSSFSVSGNVTTEFCIGRSVRCNCGTAGLFTGYITSSSYSSSTGKTTVIVSLDSGALTSQLSSVSHGNDIPTSMCRATQTSVGGAVIASSAEAVVGSNVNKIATPATVRQATLSLVRDNLGKFPGITPPSLNLFCGDATSDAAPAGTFTRSTTGTRLGQAGLIETVAAGSIRREWDTAGARKGWLVEASATNLLSYSEQIDNAAWSKSNCTVTANAAASPTGGITADKLIANATSAAHLVRGFYAFSASVNYTVSFFAKSDEFSAITTRVTDGNSNFGTVHINLANGAKSDGKTTIPLNTVVKDFGNGWWRISVSFSLSSVTASSYFDIVMSNVWPPTDNMGQTFIGDGTSGLYLWGAQLETGHYPTSYIPTTSAAVARSADVWTIPLATSWFNTATGTLFVAGRTANGVPTTETSQYLLIYVNDSFTDFIYVSRNSCNEIACFVGSGGVTIAYLNLGAVANATTFRVAFSWSSSRFSASLNGGACVTATATALPSGLTTCRIGSNAVGGRQWDGHILHSAYFPCVLSDAQLQAITL